MDFCVNDRTNDSIIIETLKKDCIPVVIWGTGEVGQLVKKRLEEGGVESIYFTRDIAGDGVILDKELDKKFDSYNLVVGFLSAYSFKEKDFLLFHNKKRVFLLSELHAYAGFTDIIDKDFFNDNAERFEKVYNRLKDDLSRDSFLAFLDAKVNENSTHLREIWTTPQYFCGDFLIPTDKEYLVDCGAFNGDSIKDFLNWTKGIYNGITAFEPEKNNITMLKKYIAENSIHSVDVIEKGAYDVPTELRFESNGILSASKDTGETIIHTDSIDNQCLNKKITFIKMDIEGSELKALFGARKTIEKYQPTLAISAYHKKDDLFNIMDYIDSICDRYDYYFRCHKPLPIDAVLYAVPKAEYAL